MPSRTQALPGAVDSLGLEVVGKGAVQVRAGSELGHSALETVYALALQNRDDFGYPWLDEASQSIRVAPITDRGRALAELSRSAIPEAFDVMIQKADVSIAQLDNTADAITKLYETGLPDAARIWMTEPDHRNNRIIVSIDEPTPALLKELVAQFGVERIAIRVEAPPKSSGPSSRDDDYPKFYGGARITTPISGCTTGYSWSAANDQSMLFAGHCAFSGGNVSYPDWPNVGQVSSATEENWSSTVGTTFFPGETTYRGDLAMIRYRGKESLPRVYDGALHASTWHSVTGNFGRSFLDDEVCANGAFGGERCGWVSEVGINFKYWPPNGSTVVGDNVWVRDVVAAVPDPGYDCPINGDSGGPIYRRRADGTLRAVGIHSGRGNYVWGCKFLFTEIMHAVYGLPGTLQTAG